MTKLLQNKSIIKFLGIALSILLIVALVPQINIAYGSKDDVLADTGTEETTDTPEVEDAGQSLADTEGVEEAPEGDMPSAGIVDEAPTPDDESANTEVLAAPMALSEDPNAEAPETDERVLADNSDDPNIGKTETVKNTRGTLNYNRRGSYTLTVEGTLITDIKVTNGATLTIKGEGIINGTGVGSVITVEGTGSKLILGEIKDGTSTGPTITNGTGTVFSGQENKRVGGGVFVKRLDASVAANNYNWSASFWMKGGTIRNNTAQAGGGIYVDAACGFTMDGGTVDSNTAEDSEGGGIFVTSAYDYNFGSYAKINAGNITNNRTETTFAWGGGGVFVNSGGALNISYASITDNTAKGLGGGVSGCPHASIAVTTVTNGAAIFKNKAQGEQFPTNPRLRLLDTDSVIQGNENKRVAAGDFLFDGLYEIAGLGTEGAGGRWSGFNASETNKSIFVQYGDYGKRADIAQYAKDFYCTRASYIAPTGLGDENGVAWKGLEIGIPAVNAKAKVSSDNIESSVVEILVAGEEEGEDTKKTTSYASLDATLGLTSQAETDPYAAGRKVNISGNYSATHGGGVASNGALEFGAYDWSNDSFEQSYELVLNKEIINSLGQEIGKNEIGGKAFNENERFSFTLVEVDGTEHHAVNGADGTISFPGLPGLEEPDFNGQSSVEKEVTFKLTEESVDGYKMLPESTVRVILEGTRKVSKFLTANNSIHTSTVYETAIKEGSVEINGSATTTVTNTLNLEANESIPVKKVVQGINEGSFEFVLNDVTNNITDLIDVDASTVKPDQDIAAAARTGSTKVAYTFEELANQEKAFEFTYKPETKDDLKSYWYAIAENPGNQEDVSYDDTAYLVKVDVALAADGRSLETAKTIYKVAPGSSTLESIPVTEDAVTFTNVKMEYAPFELALTKQVITTIQDQVVDWNDLSDFNKTFHFSVYDDSDPAQEAIFEGENNGNTIVLKAVEGKQSVVEGYVKQAYQEYLTNRTDISKYTINNLKLKEEMPSGVEKDQHMTLIADASVSIELGIESAQRDNGNTVFRVVPTVQSITLNGTRVDGSTVSNLYEPHGEWTLKADKYFQGFEEPSGEGYAFAMSELDVASDDAILNAENLASLPKKKDTDGKDLSWVGKTDAFGATENGSYKAQIIFNSVSYEVKQGDGFDGVNGENHYYLVTETASESGSADTTAFVVKVNVKQSASNRTVLESSEVARWYADDIQHGVAGTVDAIEFYNTDTYDLISAASYSVYAASGEPVDQVCYVDPKIVKNLEGRAIKSGEFAFKLIQVANYNDTEGELISATTNDEFGMVDFDKANNVSGDLENPSCLAYTKPGTYYYRVIEDASKGGMNDQSVLYSDQVITFTTVIEQDEATGQLVCTDMYYGWWDAATNQNVRFDEQYADYETQPGNIGDMSKLNPDWHPTINNKARPMDLQVRKTSVSDRDEGLVGATYALYMVNENPQGDIWLAEATSEEGGWITYKNVSLATNNLYYFKETAAPAGHTVSEFRSPYFYLVEDATSANGYALKYTDTKYFDAAEVEAAAIPMAAAEAQALQADIAAQAEAAATDDQTQPGHSADGNILLTYDKDGGVYDETTQVEVNKLDTRTHEWVEGAKLVILEKESGKEVASWTSGKAPQKLAKTLNVGITYLLREVEAPGEYRLANDVEFVIDNYGNVSITKGTENGNAELSDNTITLYDTMMDAEEVEQRERETTREVPLGTILAQTGDMLPILGIGLIVLASLIALIVARRRRRAGKDDEN